VIIFFCMKI